MQWFYVYALNSVSFAQIFLPLQYYIIFPRASAYLPLVVHLYSLNLFAMSTPMFWITCIHGNGGRQLKQFSGGRFSLLLYGVLFYLLPTVEFFTELTFYPFIKESSVWSFGVVDIGHQIIFRFSICSLIFMPVCTLYGATYLNRSLRLFNGLYFSAAQSVLELLMHVIAQVQINSSFRYCQT